MLLILVAALGPQVCTVFLDEAAFYNFCRVHESLRMTPAMAAGIADHIWSVRDILEAELYATFWA